MGQIECLLRDLGGELRQILTQVDKEEVIVRATGNELVATLDHGRGEGLRVFDDLLPVGFKTRLEGFAEADRFRCDYVHERASLPAREHGGVDCFGVLGFAENEAAAGAAEGLVCGRGHEVRMGHGRGVHAGGNQACDVGDVGE